MHRLTAILIAAILAMAIPARVDAARPYHGNGIDSYVEYLPFVTTYTLKLAGVESTSTWPQLIAGTAITIGVSTGTTWVLKRSVDKTRPDGTDRCSFPSGHTSMAFAGAWTLHRQFGHVSPWISVGGFTVAAFTGLDRIRRNRHDWVDVTAGAVLGTATAELGYWLGQKIFPSRNMHVSITPSTIYIAINL